jgi:membrane protein
MFPITSIRIVYRAITKWSENGGMRMGAALAYYALFSIAPLLLIAVHIAGAVFGEDAAKGKVFDQLRTVMGKEVAGEVQKFVATADQTSQNTFWTPLVSVLFLLIGALGAFLHVRGALCTIWKLAPPAGNTWLGMLWDYALSLIMVFSTATMVLISLACGLVVPIVQKTMQDNMIDTESYWHWVEMSASFIFLTLLFAVSYRTLSGGRISWGYVWYGAGIAAILFTIGKTLLSYYIVYTGAASMYGAAGSVVVFLMWVYYSSQILFFGAELIQARRTRYEWLDSEKNEKPIPV